MVMWLGCFLSCLVNWVLNTNCLSYSTRMIFGLVRTNLRLFVSAQISPRLAPEASARRKMALLIRSSIGMDMLFVFASWFNTTAMSHLGTVFLEGGSCRSKLFISRVIIWSSPGSYPFASLRT